MFQQPQKRARQASDILCIGDYIVDQRLTEIDCGEFEGLKETPEAFKELWLASIDGSRGVENFEDFKLRNCNFCDMVNDHYKDKDVLIVTHALNARVINYYFTGKSEVYDFKKAVARNGEIISFETD